MERPDCIKDVSDGAIAKCRESLFYTAPEAKVEQVMWKLGVKLTAVEAQAVLAWLEQPA